MAEERVEGVLMDAEAFFEAYLWESPNGEKARETLAMEKLEDDSIHAFGVGYAPVGPYVLMNHLHRLGYATEELVEAGLVTRSARGGVHAHFRSRLIFPVRDRDGQVLGFVGRGTHLGPSWSLWTTSPDTGLYRRAEAVFALDRAGPAITKSKAALVRSDCIETIRSHQEGETNAVAVHTNWVTREQLEKLAEGIRGGIDTLELDLPTGTELDPGEEASAEPAEKIERKAGGSDRMPAEPDRPPALALKRLAIVTATAVTAINVWTGAPLFAVWVGSQVQNKNLLSMWGVVTVVAVLGVVTFLLGWALGWLSAEYDQLTGRPAVAGQTSPWQRMRRGDRAEDIRSRYGISAPEKVVVASVVAAMLAFEVWFFFFAGSPI
jgi:hypothetical protein